MSYLQLLKKYKKEYPQEFNNYFMLDSLEQKIIEHKKFIYCNYFNDKNFPQKTYLAIYKDLHRKICHSSESLKQLFNDNTTILELNSNSYSYRDFSYPSFEMLFVDIFTVKGTQEITNIICMVNDNDLYSVYKENDNKYIFLPIVKMKMFNSINISQYLMESLTVLIPYLHQIKIEKQLNLLEEHIKFRPNGSGYFESKEEFENLKSNMN